MLRPRQLEEITIYCLVSPELADARDAARQVFYGDEDWLSIEYWEGADTEVSRARRFIAWFMFAYRLPDGRAPAQAAAESIFTGRSLDDARFGINGSRYVMAIVTGLEPGRSVFLEMEDEWFEVRSRELSRLFEHGTTLAAWLVPAGRGQWLFGPGWMEWPLHIGPNMRETLSQFQMDPVDVDRLFRKKTEEEASTGPDPWPPWDENLDDAVARMTAAALEENRERLVMSKDKWTGLVLTYMHRDDAMGFPGAVLELAGDVENMENVDRWLALATNIWNNTPQPDRGGKTASELLAEGHPGPGDGSYDE